MKKAIKYILYMDYKVTNHNGWLPLVKEFMTEDEAVAFVSRLEWDKNIEDIRIREFYRVVTEEVTFPQIIQDSALASD